MSKKKKDYKKQNSANKFMDLFIGQINKKRNVIKERRLEKVKNITNHTRYMFNNKKAFWNNSSGVLIKNLIKKRVHLGQHKKYVLPEMKPFILGYINDFSIINLKHTVLQLRSVLGVLQHTANLGCTFVVVGTNPTYSAYIKKFATELNMPYLASEKWIGGGLTNNKKLVENFENFQLKKMLGYDIKARRLESIHSLLDLGRIAAVIVINPLENYDVINEARILRVPVIALVDTETPLKHIDFPIVCNNKSVQTVFYILQLFYWAISSGSEFRKSYENKNFIEKLKEKYNKGVFFKKYYKSHQKKGKKYNKRIILKRN